MQYNVIIYPPIMWQIFLYPPILQILNSCSVHPIFITSFKKHFSELYFDLKLLLQVWDQGA
jgi:hypothetical protein